MWRLLWISLLVAGCESSPARNSNGTRQTFPPPAPDVPGRMVVLDYDDFGPQALAHELLGLECYSFADCCCSEPGDAFDVRVVVHDGASEAAARTRYPIGPDSGDYRIIDAAAARAFLDAQLADLASWPPEDRLPALEATLRATRVRLQASIP
ncbi:MAG TPA: hypothetical protein VMZ28_25995 [Kofleriaceae bacterium]|nr:hypothetical protein [Kofleriaceae bacterium]